MAYLKCESCGAKALAAASQCPRCTHEFDLHDARGARVPLKACRSCGILHRRDRTCHWCPAAEQQPVSVHAVGRRAAAIAAVALVGVAGWRVQRAIDWRVDAAPSMLASAMSTASSTADQASAASAPVSAEGTTVVAPPAASMDSTATMIVATTDSVRWVPAVARTWVNVRNVAGRSGEVVGIIKPSERAMLGQGQGRSGWVLVKSPEISGWVDPRLFAADSTRSRG